VASSVPGLKPAQVTITDGTGTMLWPTGDGSGSDTSTGGLPAKAAAEDRYNTRAEGDLQAMLDRSLGPGKAQVEVHSDLNVDKVDQEQLSYDTVGVPLTEKKTVESLKGSGASAGGTSGAAANLPGYAGNAASGGGKNDYKNTTTDRTLGVGKTVTKTVKAGGTPNRLDVALLVDSSVKFGPGEFAALKNSVSSAAGVQKKRGDTLNVTRLAFAKPPVAATSGGPIPAAFTGILKGVGIGLGALAFLFFVTRHLRRREREALTDEPSWLRSLEAQQAKQIMPVPAFAPEAATEVSIATSDPRRQHLDNVIHDEPERVAAHLRTWITEDAK
jgi:flagellar M-ring protein FliF